MTINEFANILSHAQVVGDGSVTVGGIQYDSRRVEKGDLFCAIPGFHTDGHLYCQEAYQRGAVAFLVERADTVPKGAPALIVPEARPAMAIVADAFYGHPSGRLWMVGVTGTNGKTTTTHLIRAVLEGSDIPCGLTGTLHTLIGQETFKVVRTTPEAPDLQRILRHMADRGMRAAVMEVSSHALVLSRVDAVEYDVGVFTNLTQDHLDFHHDIESYFRAKALLFERLGTGRPKGPRAAVINRDDPYSERLMGMTGVPVLTYGIQQPSDIRATQVNITSRGVQFVAEFPEGVSQPVEFGMPGRFNVLNALAAMAVGYVYGLTPSEMAESLARYPGVPGRFERIDEGQPFTVIVDYAHTPDGLENALKTAREFSLGKIGVVFGAGGDRDRGKRPLMGEVAGRLADWTVLTADNPRSEDPLDIIHQIAEGVNRVGGQWQQELDRERAIRLALNQAQPGDVVLIVGKGHETYQIYRDATIHFDDREVARQILRELNKG
ncbi:UDP-N-acetylmuramyl-tripeptide synthetase [Sulfobacillus acidophilus TPY]|uniref:UDP-N-acetylmuramoyl-L-alanyl-D-glutamate--2,6-diaminopimelate ligase n=1 Tax=Sulfobacillus acidophilus (strain ATCC 700253 / DSM 10332 / NAL) TaxID=679936 RepID=G8TX25_SULAD|nr:UDP-N-acetylmuramyl-tripeptide synthetase [Sulfobacillus acidophilus TPY]AEW04933.1 UDP-N-acetylmuramoylalanyl-D-glutamate--2,6-diaminopimelate ligase [Sulfobacillus acidophilus DSM 10332]